MCAKIRRSSIVNEKRLNFDALNGLQKASLQLLFQLYMNCQVDQKKTVAISQMFNHINLHVHKVYLLKIGYTVYL